MSLYRIKLPNGSFVADWDARGPVLALPHQACYFTDRADAQAVIDKHTLALEGAQVIEVDLL